MNRKTILLFAAVLLMMLPVATFADGIQILHGPYLQNVYETEATIVWTTNNASNGWVEIAPDDKSNFYSQERPKYYDSHIGIKRIGTVHAVRITGLKPGTKYRYRIYSQEVLKREGWHIVWGYVAATDVFGKAPLTFTTNDRTKPETSFVVLNDIHQRIDVMKQMLEAADYKHRDAVIYNGDMVNILPDDQVLFSGFLDESIKMFASEQPFYYVRGNHETRGAGAANFHTYVCPQQPNLYFAWQQGPVFFIALDSGEDKPDDDIEYAGANAYDVYRTEQAEWIKQVVNSEEYKRAKYHVVICHVPPANTPDAWHGDYEIKEKFLPALSNAKVDVMLCAHYHRFSWIPSIDGADFPVIINSNNSYITGETNNGKLNIKVVDTKGKTLLDKDFAAK